MDVKEVIGERKPKDDSEGLRMVKAAIKVIFSHLFRSVSPSTRIFDTITEIL